MQLPIVDSFILSAQEPSRYAGGEPNAVRKDLSKERVNSKAIGAGLGTRSDAELFKELRDMTYANSVFAFSQWIETFEDSSERALAGRSALEQHCGRRRLGGRLRAGRGCARIRPGPAGRSRQQRNVF